MTKRILLGNPQGRNMTVSRLEAKNGKIVESYKETVLVGGENTLVDFMEFEDGSLVGFTDRGAFYGTLDPYVWTEEKGYVNAK